MLIMALPIVSAFESTNTDNELSAREVKKMGEEVLDKIPETYDVTADKITVPNRFLLYTHNGKDVMWGTYGNGYFRGKDNHGKYTWGIYGNKIFAGMYDGEFFWGKYSRNRWKAFGLFGQKRSHGKFVLFPPITIEPIPIHKPVKTRLASPTASLN